MTVIDRTSRPDDELSNAAHAASTFIGFAWPTGRPIYRYTAAELAAGVDLYTRAMKARVAGTHRGGHDARER